MRQRPRVGTIVERAPAWLATLALLGVGALAIALDAGVRPSAASSVPRRTGWARWKHIVSRTYQQIGEDRLLSLAAGVVFYALLALFPAITALVSCYALFADPATIDSHLAMIASVVPAGGYSVVQEQIARIASGTTGGLSLAFFIGLAIALWSANSGMKAIIDALNIAYEARERRGFIRLTLVSLAMTVAAIVGMLVAIAAVVVSPIVIAILPFSGFADSMVVWLRWPALILLLMLGLAALYRFGPDREHPRWHWCSAGNVFAALAWLAGSLALSWYLSNFANYNATYGSLGAGIGLMMWLWMTAVVVLVGAELNSEIENADSPYAAPDGGAGFTRTP